MEEPKEESPVSVTEEQTEKNSLIERAENLVGEMRTDLESVNESLKATSSKLDGLWGKLEQMQEDLGQLGQMFRLPRASEESSELDESSDETGSTDPASA